MTQNFIVLLVVIYITNMAGFEADSYPIKLK